MGGGSSLEGLPAGLNTAGSDAKSTRYRGGRCLGKRRKGEREKKQPKTNRQLGTAKSV